MTPSTTTAPTRNTTLPTSAALRKQIPISSGCLDYFPDAIAAIAKLSWVGNNQHNSGKPLHWDRAKSGDEGDALMRHYLRRGSLDSEGVPETVKVAWRALALLQKEIEAEPAMYRAYFDPTSAPKPELTNAEILDLLLHSAGLSDCSSARVVSPKPPTHPPSQSGGK
jgi:hypothetical protein